MRVLPVKLLWGDCVEVMAKLDADSVDAIVCDPPYGLEFMGKEWDRPWVGRGDNPGSSGLSKGGYTSSNGYADRQTPAYGRGWRNSRCRLCGHITSGASPCICEVPELVVEGPGAVPVMQAFQAWCEDWATQALRVLKPGGHLLAFGGTRTYHRMVCAIEDAGFEIRDSIHWMYGSGFPKSLNVSKAIDKAAGATREVLGRKTDPRYASSLGSAGGSPMGHLDSRVNGAANYEAAGNVTAPATPEATKWDGWGTALKPAHEPIVVARKPFPGTVAANVLTHGTGALNIDASRIAHGPEVSLESMNRQTESDTSVEAGWRIGHSVVGQEVSLYKPGGRWPANVILSHADGCELVGERQIKGSNPFVVRPSMHAGWKYDDGRQQMERADAGKEFGHAVDGQETIPAYVCVEGCPVAELDAQSGITKSTGGRNANISATSTIYGGGKGLGQDLDPASVRGDPGLGDTGGASRFFYCAKASKSERSRGLETRNTHPTVKPVALMAYLVKLVTPAGGLVLDPFMGSGTTGVAAVQSGCAFVGIEKSKAEYRDIAMGRIRYAIDSLYKKEI